MKVQMELRLTRKTESNKLGFSYAIVKEEKGMSGLTAR